MWEKHCDENPPLGGGHHRLKRLLPHNFSCCYCGTPAKQCQDISPPGLPPTVNKVPGRQQYSFLISSAMSGFSGFCAADYESCTARSRAPWPVILLMRCCSAVSISSHSISQLCGCVSASASNILRVMGLNPLVRMPLRYMMNLKQKQAEAYAQKLKRFFMTLDASGHPAT